MAGRKSMEKDIDVIIGEWTSALSAEEVMIKMQNAGVRAGVVKNAEEIYNDRQLRERNLFWPLEHAETGTFTHLGTSFEMSGTPGRPYMPSPGLGEHTEYICSEVLGLTDEEFIGYLQEGVFE